MIKHVVLLLLSAVCTNAAYKKSSYNRFKHTNNLTFDDPLEAWFPELEFHGANKEYFEEFVKVTDKDKRLEAFSTAASLWKDIQAANLKPARKYAFLQHMAQRYGKTHGKAVEKSKMCEAEHMIQDAPWGMDKIFAYKRAEEMEGAMWINQERYIKYIYNMPDKPWLLMFVKAPYENPTESHYQTHTVLMPRMYCSSQALGVNVGFIDLFMDELILEAFNYKTIDYGFTVPYYVYIKDGKACHLPQQLYSASVLQETIANCTQGIGMRIESVPYPRNKYNLYWEYTKKDIAIFWSYKMTRRFKSWWGISRGDWKIELWQYWFGALNYGEKQAGWYIILEVIIPALILIFLLLRFIYNCLCSCCCSGSMPDKVKAEGVQKLPSSPEKKTRQKVD